MRYLLLTLALACVAPSAAQAQHPARGGFGGQQGVVRGSVVDAASGHAIANASVALRSGADSSLVTGAMTRADGSFALPGLRPGHYYVRITALGYGPRRVSPVDVSAGSPVVDLGVVKLTAAALQIQGLEVTGEQRDVQLAPDHNSYVTKDMPAVSGGSAVDVLRNVPSVEVDQDGNVSLRGNQSVVIQINGRPTPMTGPQLAAFLQQLPASMVAKVDVIPNPSAKYDPEGMGGIINLELKKNTELGASAGILLNASTNGRYNASGNVGYQKGRVTFYGSYGYSADKRSNTGFNYRENLFEDPMTILQQDISGDRSRHSNNVNASFDYKLSQRNVLSTQFLFGKSSGENKTLNAYQELSASRDTTGLYERLTGSDDDFQNLSATLGFKHTVQQLRDEFSASVRYARNERDANERFMEQTLTLQGEPDASQPVLDRDLHSDQTDEWTAQADLTHPLGGSAKLEAGYKGTLRALDNGLFAETFDYDQNAYLPETERNNQFNYSEQVHALYGVLTGQVGRFELQGGLRLERATTHFDLTDVQNRYENDYTSLFPSALVAYNPTDTRQFKISYSKRVDRPRTRMLNPIVDSEDPLNLFVGNPYLKPEYTHSFELGWQESLPHGTIQLTPYYRHTVNVVRRIKTIDDNGVSTTTFQNLDTGDSWGTDLTASLRLSKLTGFVGLNGYQMVTNGDNVGDNLGSNAFGWSARVNANWIVTPSLAVQGFWMYRAPMDVEQGHVSGFSFLNFGLRQKLAGDHAAITLRVMDPFDTMGFGFVTRNERFYQRSRQTFGARGVYLGFSYNVGQKPRIRGENGPQDQEPPDQPDTGIH
ncbi:MAG TPA: TonB dependent receptor [Longimicrobiaceae bacterium]|nr:TonB dependent receptor [Longimicrobiaceae bacterium]